MKRRAVTTWFRLVHVFQRMDRALMQNLRQWDMTLAQFDVLAHVGSAEGITQQELADKLLVTKGNVCQLLDRLSAQGLLERRQEGRVNRIALTPAGRALYERVVPAQEAAIEALLGALDPQEQAELATLLRRLERGLSASGAPHCVPESFSESHSG